MMKLLEKSPEKYAAELEDFLLHTDAVVFIVLDEELNISSHNECFKKLISAGRDVRGHSIRGFLLPESKDLLPLPDSGDRFSGWLNFNSPDSSVIPLSCRINRTKDGRHIIFGGRLMLSGDRILEKMTTMSNEMANIARDLHRKNRELEEAHSQIKILSGIIPICMYCKEIKDDKGYWNKLETFISNHSEAEFSHCICDDCLRKHFPEAEDEEEEV